MVGYACVYRHYPPSRKDRAHAEAAAASNPILQSFMERYDESYFDWGDDPSFFAAIQILGNVRRASWGVCRSDVRRALKEGDFVVFFVGRERGDGDGWDYYWVGIGTVRRLIQDRRKIWTDPSLQPYGEFLNLLVAPDLSHREFFPEHPDWEKRIRSPYVLFDPELSRFDLTSPVHVSTYTRDGAVSDRWRGTTDSIVSKLETLLFRNRDRRLRTSHKGFGHAKIRLSGTDRELLALRSELIRLFDSRFPGNVPTALTSVSRPRIFSQRRGCG
jgi:hypothetical protein